MTRLVLAGAGHAHAQVLRDWARAPLPGVELVVVSPQALAPYSGMVPGWLAGFYRLDEITIDFAALSRAAGARWIADEVDAVDPDRRQVRLRSGDAIDFALLSLNVGATLRPPPGAHVLSMRPLSRLADAWDATLQRWSLDPSGASWTVSAVGGGAAGVESLLAVLARLRRLRPDRTVLGRLVSRSTRLLPGVSCIAQRAARRALERAGVTLHLGIDGDHVATAGSDLVLWATGAQAHDWQRDPARRGSLAVGGDGFVRIDAQLRSVSHPSVFAVGDCAEWQQPLPKAGVYAVRMGPVLSANLRAALGRGTLRRWRPQRRFLMLLATGDGRAIASRGPVGAEGAWVWHWKDRIDRRFVRGFG